MNYKYKKALNDVYLMENLSTNLKKDFLKWKKEYLKTSKFPKRVEDILNNILVLLKKDNIDEDMDIITNMFMSIQKYVSDEANDALSNILLKIT
jgi:hypothetical protein